jgi:hypothetical protein
MVIRMAELGEPFECLFTPTGNEPAEVMPHILGVCKRIDRKLVMPENQSLEFWMGHYNALPNWRQRWCTRQIKIEPTVEFLKARPGSTLAAALRADEDDREGLYSDLVTYRRPLKEWGWGLKEVWAYLRENKQGVPTRTDCKLCYGQRIGEWYELWRTDPAGWAQGEAWERQTGHTFRSPSRDTWPAALVDLRKAFESGRAPKGYDQKNLFAEDCETVEPDKLPCRVCRL